MVSRHSGGVWAAGQTLQSGITAGLTQISMSPPSNEALAVAWAEPSGTKSNVRWRGYALDTTADGATWNSSDGATPWMSPGGDESGAAIASEAAPNVIGGVLSMDFTAQVESWHTGAPNNGFVLRKQTDNPVLDDWKAYYSSEAPTPSLRPHLTIDYDVASITMSQPNAATAWRNGQTAEVTWQTSGSGLTHVNLWLSDDDGGTWSPITSGIANTGSYMWQVAGTTGNYRIKVEALALGVPAAEDTSASFVVEDIQPSPITTLGVNTPSSTATLTWLQPADSGGAGMANGTYRVYRSASAGVQGNRIATIASALTYTDNSALADGSWYYTVIPVDAAGNVQAVGNDQVMTEHDGSAPNPVSDLAAPGLTNVPVALTWSAVTDVGAAGIAGYRVYRSNTAGIRGSLLTTVGGTSTSDTPPSDGTWYYTIAAVDATDNVRLTGNNQVGAVYDSTAPAPVGITLDAGASWTTTTAVTAALTYGDATDVQLSESAVFLGATWVPVGASLPVTLAASDGSHTVYARFRDLAGNVSGTVNDDIGVDRQAPAAVTPMRDGGGASDVDYQSSSTQLQAAWSASSDATSGVARYDVCFSTATTCGGTVLAPWTSTGTTTSATAGSLALTPGQIYFACVRAVDVAGNVLNPVNCTDGVTVTSISSASPATLPQGRRSVVISVTGTGFDPAVTAAFSGSDVTVTNVARVSSTQLDLTLDVASSGTPGTRNLTVTSPDSSTVVGAAAITIGAPAITVTIGTLDFDGTSAGPSGSGPFGLNFGRMLPGTTREIGTASSGQAVPGAAIDLGVESDTDWIVTAAATDFAGPAALPASALAWKHHGVSEAWSPFSTTAAGIESAHVPNTPATTTLSYDLQWTIPAAHAAGAYSTNLALVVAPAI
jgi:hypothetical protein